MEEVITTKKGSFGYVRVAVPMTVKATMLTWCNRSGMGRAEFFRVALMMGIKLLAESVNATNQGEGYKPYQALNN
jgi:hypothetical protein